MGRGERESVMVEDGRGGVRSDRDYKVEKRESTKVMEVILMTRREEEKSEGISLP